MRELRRRGSKDDSRRMLVRQWQIVRALSSKRQGLTIAEIEAETGYSRSTVYRDLKVLREAGVPLTSESRSGATRTRLLVQAELPAIGLSALQITALHLARRALEPLAGTGYVTELDQLLHKLQPPEHQQTLRFGKRAAGRPQILETVERAMHSRRRARLDYRAASRNGAVTTIHVEPLLLNVADRDPYLRAYCVERGAERTYKIARIVAAELTETPFSHSPSKPAESAFEHSVKAWTGEPTVVKVRLDPAVAWLAPEFPLVPAQHTVAQPDGGVVIEARVAGIVEASRWVLSWGGAAEALEPEALRERTRSELAKALGHYEGPGPVKARPGKSTRAEGSSVKHGETGRA